MPKPVEGAELIEVLGEAATIALADEFAGTRLYIPDKIGDDHEIARAIGREATDALHARFGMVTIRVPLLRKLRARQMLANGWCQRMIAFRLGMTETGVGKLLKSLGLKSTRRGRQRHD